MFTIQLEAFNAQNSLRSNFPKNYLKTSCKSAREYVSGIAKTVKEACQPIEEGFEYVCDFDGIRLFKKEETTLEL